MKHCLSGLIIAFSINLSAQSPYSPFIGGFEFGIGYSNVIDFNRENNIKYSKDLTIEPLFFLFPFIPYQFGFVTAKYVNHYSYFELGMIFRKSSVGWIELHPPGGWSLPGINFYSFDFPLKYYFPTKISAKNLDAYLGLIPSWLFNPEVVGGQDHINIDEIYFREAYLSFCSGIIKEKGNVRTKLHA